MSLDFSHTNILVVEKTEPIRKLIYKLLKTIGVERVIEAQGGEEAFNLYRKLNPDIIITGYAIPKLNGLDLVHEIRNNPLSPNPEIAIILISGYMTPHRLDTARNTGINEFLLKPFTAKDLARSLAFIVNKPRNFVETENYFGPERRHHKNNHFNGLFQRNRDKNPIKKPERKILKITNRKKIKKRARILRANYTLQSKVGIGLIKKETTRKCQELINKYEYDFTPLAYNTIDNIQELLCRYEEKEEHCEDLKEDISDLVMDLKSNASMFYYQNISNISYILLNFIESLKTLDNNAIEVIRSGLNMLSSLIDKEINEDKGVYKLQRDMRKLCRDYFQNNDNSHANNQVLLMKRIRS